MKTNDFESLLKQNNMEEIRKYLINYGKVSKPYCPFYFVDKNDNEYCKGEQDYGRKENNESINV